MYKLKEKINNYLNEDCSFKNQTNNLNTWEKLGFKEDALVHISTEKQSVQVVLLNDIGEVLSVSRKDNHNDAGLIGGKVDLEDDGDLIRAAIRETKEETGLDIFNLRPIFSMHKDGFMGYTYLADYNHNQEIKTDEPHVVKWAGFKTVIDGSFGKWNALVAESLTNMGIVIKF